MTASRQETTGRKRESKVDGSESTRRPGLQTSCPTELQGDQVARPDLIPAELQKEYTAPERSLRLRMIGPIPSQRMKEAVDPGQGELYSWLTELIATNMEQTKGGKDLRQRTKISHGRILKTKLQRLPLPQGRLQLPGAAHFLRSLLGHRILSHPLSLPGKLSIMIL